MKLNINCSKGTYIRSIANDIGEKLGTGAYLKELVRDAIGDYNLADAIDLDDFLMKYKADSIELN